MNKSLTGVALTGVGFLAFAAGATMSSGPGPFDMTASSMNAMRRAPDTGTQQSQTANQPLGQASGQVSNGAGDQSSQPQSEGESLLDTPKSADDSGRTWPAQTWRMPAIVVEGQRASTLREEDLIGSYRQPRWTATRRFTTTRVYVIPEGKVEVEAWGRATTLRASDGGGTEWRVLQEVEIGLPNRFQLDLYARQDFDAHSGQAQWGGQFEVRYALADWGEIFGNPTLYMEYIVLDDQPDKIEPKVLFGGELAQGWHWGLNLVGEFEMGGAREYEYEVTTGISRTLIDETLSFGVESLVNMSNEQDDRGHLTTYYLIGPSLQWKPFPRATINIAPLIGVTGHSPTSQIYLNAGFEF